MRPSATRSARYIAILAVVSVGILATGIAVRRSTNTGQPAPPPPPSETDLLRLARLSQRQSLEDMARYLGSVADQAQRSIVSLPGGSGVLWPDGLVVTGAGEAKSVAARVAGPHLPIAAVDAPEATGTAAVLRADAARPGEWIVAVWRQNHERAYAAGSVTGAATLTCRLIPVREILTTIPFSAVIPGAGIFDVDGKLMALVIPCDERMIAVSPGDIDAMLKAGRSDEGRVLAAFGVRLDRLSPEDAEHFGVAEGVVVREVWDGHAAALGGLRPGDIVRAIDGHPVATLEEARLRLLSTAEPLVRMLVRRMMAEVKIDLPRAQGETVSAQEAPLGIVWEGRRPGYPIDEISPGSAAARAGLQPGDVVLRVDHAEPRSLAELQRRLAGSRSTSFLEIQRGPRRLGLLLRQLP